MSAILDSISKRIFKFLLKRHLGQLLKNEVELNIQAGSTVSFEARKALLNCDYLNSQLVRACIRIQTSCDRQCTSLLHGQAAASRIEPARAASCRAPSCTFAVAGFSILGDHGRVCWAHQGFHPHHTLDIIPLPSERRGDFSGGPAPGFG